MTALSRWSIALSEAAWLLLLGCRTSPARKIKPGGIRSKRVWYITSGSQCERMEHRGWRTISTNLKKHAAVYEIYPPKPRVALIMVMVMIVVMQGDGAAAMTFMLCGCVVAVDLQRGAETHHRHAGSNK